MKYINPPRGIRNVDYSDVKNPDKKKSKLWKWIKKIAFFIFLFLLFLEFNHMTLAIEALQYVNTDQMNLINELGHKVNSLQNSNIDLQTQVQALKLKISGMELHDSFINNIHNVTHQVSQHIDSPTYDTHTVIHNAIPDLKPVVAITTVAIGVFTVLKTVMSMPALLGF